MHRRRLCAFVGIKASHIWLQPHSRVKKKANKTKKLHNKLKQDSIYRMYNYYRFSLRMYVLCPLQQRVKKTSMNEINIGNSVVRIKCQRCNIMYNI